MNRRDFLKLIPFGAAIAACPFACESTKKDKELITSDNINWLDAIEEDAKSLLLEGQYADKIIMSKAVMDAIRPIGCTLTGIYTSAGYLKVEVVVGSIKWYNIITHDKRYIKHRVHYG